VPSKIFGTAVPFTLPMHLDEDQRDLLHLLARGLLVQREDSAQNFVRYLDAAAACPEQSFVVADIAGQVPQEVADPTRVFRNLLTSSRWPEVRLMDTLFEAAQLSKQSIVVVGHQAPTAKSHHSVVWLQALGYGTSVPLDWRRFRTDEDDHDARFQACVHELLDELLGRCASPVNDLPLIVTLDEAIGEWPSLRFSIAERVGRYASLVSRHYPIPRLNTAIYSQRNPGGRLASSFGEWPLAGPPAPMALKRSGSRFVEYAVPFVNNGHRCYAIVGLGPRIGNCIQGRTAISAATDIGTVLGLIQPDPIATMLGIQRFEHSSDKVFHRHAMLMSMLYTVVTRQLGLIEASLRAARKDSHVV
jgi:hypothetical protein